MKKTLATLVLTSLTVSTVGCQTSNFGRMGDSRVDMGRQQAPQLRVNRVGLKASSLGPQATFVPGELIVKFRPGAAAQAASQTMRSLGVSQVTPIGSAQSGIQLVKLNAGTSMTNALRALQNNPGVLYAEPNSIVNLPRYQAEPFRLAAKSEQPAAYPNDEMFDQQYAHKVTESQKGWAVNQGSENVVVAIVDTGVDLKHPDLAGKLAVGRDIVDSDDEPMDGQGHGTHCAGIAAAITNNGVGVAGYAPGVKVMPVRVLDDRGSGTYADVAAGIVWAAEHGAHVISMSLGGPRSSKAIEDAIKLALSKDVLVIAAMGNSGNNSKSYPAAIPGVMAVGATDSSDKKASFSQYGKWISVGAPGVKILSTFPTYSSGMPGENYGSISGTSMATPAVAGLAGLVRSQFPNFNQQQVRDAIEKSADDLGAEGFDDYYGHGRINVAKALGAGSNLSQVQAMRFGR